MVISSAHKHKSHEMINKVLFKWLEFHWERGKECRVVTMPSISGRQENLIINHMNNFQLEEHWVEYRDRHSWTAENIKLLTFDNMADALNTNIVAPDRKVVKWEHFKCVDIFRKMLKLGLREIPTAAWFDMTGALTDKTWSGIQDVVERQFADGSLLFVTLAIDGPMRAFTDKNYAHRVYSSFCKKRVSRKFVTELMLTELIENTGKYVKQCIDSYVYKNGKSTFGVFGYIIGES